MATQGRGASGGVVDRACSRCQERPVRPRKGVRSSGLRLCERCAETCYRCDERPVEYASGLCGPCARAATRERKQRARQDPAEMSKAQLRQLERLYLRADRLFEQLASAHSRVSALEAKAGRLSSEIESLTSAVSRGTEHASERARAQHGGSGGG